LLTAAYSLIAYKTPWCILSFLHGWILLAGIGTASFVEWCRNACPKGSVAILLALLLVPAFATFRLAQRAVFRYAADPRNPYAYAHTSPDFMNLVRRIGNLADASPKGNGLYVQVIAPPDATWPLPFYLKRLPNVGYWTDAESVPGKVKPDLIISTPAFETDPADFLSEYYGLRTDTLLALHIDHALWNQFLDSRR
jgi:hypothetical protein